jgi:hypothetical protein
MTKFDDLDKRAFAALDADFEISDETATVEGEMRITVIRPADSDQFWLTITFPGGELFDVRIARVQLLEQLDIEADES